MKLSELVKELEYTGAEKCMEEEVTALCYDSRKEMPKNSIFVCIKGASSDGHDFAGAALENGCCAVVAEHVPEGVDSGRVIVVEDTRKALSLLAAAWFGYPARSLKTIGVTGTKGKSTTTYMIRDILEKAGHKVGVIGTIGVSIGGKMYPTGNTTPESFIVQQYFRQMVDEGCDVAVMEVSSQGLKQSRVYGVMFDYGLFTNLEADHIGKNEHESFEEYVFCKSLLFKQCRTGIFNADDAHMHSMTESCTCSIETYGIENSAAVKGSNIRLINGGGRFGVSYDITGEDELNIELSIPGRFNIYNSLAAFAVCRHFTSDHEAVRSALASVKVLGRLEPVDISDRFVLMIDYAHNAMALESLLRSLREYRPARLVCLFGCGGNRARDRRFEMGEVSSRLADLTVVTSDNPRFEEPDAIIGDILTGVKKADGAYVTIPDRREAIRYVIENAMDGDLIVLAGKGNEDYQEIKGVKYHMDEREIIAEIVGGGNH